MSEIDYDKLSSLVVSKLETKNRPNRDDEFVKKLVSEMIEHRSPCHNLDIKDVASIKEVIKKYKKIDKGIAVISWAVILYLVKSGLEFLAINVHWGE